MVAGSFTVNTVIDEVRLALNWKGTDAIITDAEISRFVYANMESSIGTYTFQLATASSAGPTGVYKCNHGSAYGLFLWAPTMTVEDDCVYVIQSRGAISVTSGTPVATLITVQGTPVDFAQVMVELLHWLATHRAQEISVSAGSGSMGSQGIHDQLIQMADYWQGVNILA